MQQVRERSEQKQAWKQTKRNKKRKQKEEKKKKKKAEINVSRFKRGENDQPVCF